MLPDAVPGDGANHVGPMRRLAFNFGKPANTQGGGRLGRRSCPGVPCPHSPDLCHRLGRAAFPGRRTVAARFGGRIGETLREKTSTTSAAMPAAGAYSGVQQAVSGLACPSRIDAWTAQRTNADGATLRFADGTGGVGGSGFRCQAPGDFAANAMRRPTSTDFRNAADVSVGNGLVSGLRQVSCIASGLPIFGRGFYRMSDQFQNQLVDFLPKMGTWALALTRNRAAADDLVPGCRGQGARCGRQLHARHKFLRMGAPHHVQHLHQRHPEPPRVRRHGYGVRGAGAPDSCGPYRVA